MVYIVLQVQNKYKFIPKYKWVKDEKGFTH